MAVRKSLEPKKAFTDILQELKDLPQWVVWGVDKNNPKKPHSPETLSPEDWRNPKNWGVFNKAISRVESAQARGVGFVFNGNGFYGVDLDNVFIDGELIPEAEDVVDTLKSYTEISQSGMGLHIIVKAADLDLKISKVVFEFKNYLKDKKRHIEFYQSTGYFALTGNVYSGLNKLNKQAKELKAVYDKYSGTDKETAQTISPHKQYEPLFDNETLISKAIGAANGFLFNELFTGDWGLHYASQSDADLALCNILAFWTGRNATQMDEIFRSSVLMRDKWGEKHFADGRTYGEATIQEAINKCDKVYYAYEIPDFYDGKRFLHNVMGDYLIQSLNVCKINGALHIYDNGIYKTDEDIIHGYMIKLIPTLQHSKRVEVFRYMKASLNTPKKEISPANLIPFRTRIYDLKTNGFLDYNPRHVFLNRFPYKAFA